MAPGTRSGETMPRRGLLRRAAGGAGLATFAPLAFLAARAGAARAGDNALTVATLLNIKTLDPARALENATKCSCRAAPWANG